GKKSCSRQSLVNPQRETHLIINCGPSAEFRVVSLTAFAFIAPSFLGSVRTGFILKGCRCRVPPSLYARLWGRCEPRSWTRAFCCSGSSGHISPLARDRDPHDSQTGSSRQTNSAWQQPQGSLRPGNRRYSVPAEFMTKESCAEETRKIRNHCRVGTRSDGGSLQGPGPAHRPPSGAEDDQRRAGREA